MNTYAIGAGVDLDFFFRDAAGVLTDPSVVTVEVQHPNGDVDTYAITDLTRLSIGTYRLRVVPDAAGKWYYRASTTGSLTAATLDQAFYVEATRFP